MVTWICNTCGADNHHENISDQNLLCTTCYNPIVSKTYNRSNTKSLIVNKSVIDLKPEYWIRFRKIIRISICIGIFVAAIGYKFNNDSAMFIGLLLFMLGVIAKSTIRWIGIFKVLKLFIKL